MKLKSSSKRHFVGLGTVAFALLFVVFTAAIAQNLGTSQSLQVTPPSQELSADPGKTVTVKTTLRNPDKQSISVKTRIEDFTASGEEGQIALIDAGDYSLTGWTNISPATFTLGPGESQVVTATIRVPASAAGGRYGSFVFSVTPGTDDGGTALVAQEIASIFLMRIAGPVDEQLSLNEFKGPAFVQHAPVPLSMKFKNSGNIHVKTFGLVNVTGMFNRKVADIVVKPENVFPGSERVITTNIDTGFMIGPYTATAIMYYGTKNQAIDASTSFFVFPVKEAAIAAVVLFVLFLIRKRLRKAFKALFS